MKISSFKNIFWESSHGDRKYLPEWPRPTHQRSAIERFARRFFMFPRSRHKKSFVLTTAHYCQSYEYQNKKLKRIFPWRYWLANDIDRPFIRAKYQARELKYWFYYRLRPKYRYHVLKLDRKPGYSDTGEDMVVAMFTQVRDFAEIELASKNRACRDENSPKFTFVKGRCREAGIEYLDWEINEPDCKMGAWPTQADAAQIHKDCYLWWVDERPARLDPYEIKRHFKRDADPDGFWHGVNSDDPERKRYLESMSALEEFYHQEDKEMMEKAISVLRSWWT